MRSPQDHCDGNILSCSPNSASGERNTQFGHRACSNQYTERAALCWFRVVVLALRAGVQVCRCAGVQLCSCPAVQVSRCPGVQVCRCAGVQVCRCAGVQIVHVSNCAGVQCPGVQACSCPSCSSPGVQVCRCAGGQVCRCAGVQLSRCAAV